ncbi:TPA: hypothetical protein N0F65_009380 [Lagenidium giganteum]|uniref:Uncharacterized protein n=1 Tax=Lagenidium giganteum TaxID=4803 RepID=A0AAV2Z9C5_9STRA|nr:TPA: hypothetical protein N0F65_009380 [Lagenidium giganteum]
MASRRQSLAATANAATVPPPNASDNCALHLPNSTVHYAFQPSAAYLPFKERLVVGVMLYDGATVLDFMGPMQYLDFLRMFYNVPIEIVTIGTRIDVVLVPGAGPQALEPVVADAQYMAFIRRMAERAKTVTTNKSLFTFIANQYPRVNWQPRARWVVDGNLWSSSGISAGMDMMWAFIANVYGQNVADSLATLLEIVPTRNASDDPFTPTPELTEFWSQMSKLAANP